MTKEQFAAVVARWGGDEQTARRLVCRPRTVQAVRLGYRAVPPRMAEMIRLIDPAATQPRKEPE